MRYKRKKNYWQQDIRRRDYLLAVLTGSFVILMFILWDMSMCNSIGTLFSLFFKIMGKTVDRKKKKCVSDTV